MPPPLVTQGANGCLPVAVAFGEQAAHLLCSPSNLCVSPSPSQHILMWQPTFSADSELQNVMSDLAVDDSAGRG